MKDDPCVVCFILLVDLVVSRSSAGDRGMDIVEDHLDHLDLFLKAIGRWDGSTDV